MSLLNGESRAAAEKVAQNVLITAAARLAQLVGIPAGLAVAGWLVAALLAVQQDVAAIKATIAVRIETATIREALQEQRIGELEHAMRGGR